MIKAIIKTPFSVVQWHGDDYPYYEEDAQENTFKVGDEVLVLHEAAPNPMGRLFVIFNERINESTIVSENYIELIEQYSKGDEN